MSAAQKQNDPPEETPRRGFLCAFCTGKARLFFSCAVFSGEAQWDFLMRFFCVLLTGINPAFFCAVFVREKPGRVLIHFLCRETPGVFSALFLPGKPGGFFMRYLRRESPGAFLMLPPGREVSARRAFFIYFSRGAFSPRTTGRSPPLPPPPASSGPTRTSLSLPIRGTATWPRSAPRRSSTPPCGRRNLPPSLSTTPSTA